VAAGVHNRMALKTKLGPKTGIYRNAKTTLLPGGDPDEVAAAIADLNRSYQLSAVLEDCARFAQGVLRDCGVTLSTTNPYDQNDVDIDFGGDWFLLIPKRRPLSIKIPGAPRRATQDEITNWWRAIIATAKQVLFYIREVRDFTAEGKHEDALVRAYRL